MLRKSVLDVIIPKLRQRMLSAILLRPDRSWYLTELARHLNVRASSLQRDLAAWVKVGLLTTARRGRLVLYSANPDHTLLPELRGLLIKTVGITDVIRNALLPMHDEIAYAFIYGSIAAGETHMLSDVDLMVVADIRPARLSQALRLLQEQIGREINHKFYLPAEFAAKRAAGDGFLSNVLRKPKIMLIGEKYELVETSGREPRQARTRDES